jgi:hypothetical protein
MINIEDNVGDIIHTKLTIALEPVLFDREYPFRNNQVLEQLLGVLRGTISGL